MVRASIKGRPMCDIRNMNFEQQIRDAVKVQEWQITHALVSVDIIYNDECHSFIIDIVKAVLDGLNGCAYEDDGQVVHLSAARKPGIKGTHIGVKEISSAKELKVDILSRPSAKVEAYRQMYSGEESVDELLIQHLMMIHDKILAQTSAVINGEVSIEVNIYDNCSNDMDLDNMIKLYLKSLISAGVVNEDCISSLIGTFSPIHEDQSRVDININRLC